MKIKVALLFLVILPLYFFLFSSCSQSDVVDPAIHPDVVDSVVSPSNNFTFVFPVDTGYTWTYKYYYIGGIQDLSGSFYTTQWGSHLWRVISKQVYKDSTVFNVLNTQDDSVHSIHHYYHWNNNPYLSDSVVIDTTYTINSEISFPIIVTNDKIIIKWNYCTHIAYPDSLDVIHRITNTKIDTLKYNFVLRGRVNQLIFINDIGLVNLYYLVGGISGGVSESMELINYYIGK